MQQRGVIVTAVILALILAGALWYTLTRDVANPLTLTPTPTEVPLESPAPTPDNLIAVASPDPGIVPAPTVESTSVSATAPTGMAENMIAGIGSVTVIALWQLSKSLRRGLN